ncbi:MAG: threonylcarbamoyl-AMP synthase [Verrucomicrobia bacterium 13_2_20CM_55_10]|nr:MAG: threonylcarbamoyl-AMP synthase [Verrucomicrobia bacterium 13_2_20CM_55_10]
MRTVISTDRTAAVELLRRGEIVALPTETVYGLAADALNPMAVAKIFEAKERPRFDPLIVHLPSRDWLEKIVDPMPPNRQLILRLADKFWPGPLTMVLPKRGIIPEIVTAGLDMVAVRISAHPIFAEIIHLFGKPLAAPSANRFGRVSPTAAEHVLDELDGRISLVIDAGPTHHGLESTIVSVRANGIEILRRGPITAERLSEFAEVNTVASPARRISAPGQFPSHYAPKTQLRLIDCAESFFAEKDQRVGLLAWNPRSRKGDLQIGQRRTGSELDALGLDLIVAERVPGQGLGAAILDRLERASRG